MEETPSTSPESPPKVAATATPAVSVPRWKADLNEVISFARTLALFLAAAFFLRASMVEPFKIPSGSMRKTLQEGDYILVNKLSYGLRLPFFTDTLYSFSTPRRGDIVVFVRIDDPMTTENEAKDHIIKRVVGLPGDIVEVKGTQVYINHQPLRESYAVWDKVAFREGNFAPETVPPGKVFLLGDNRDHSKDSRFWNDPFLPMHRITGRALIIYWSWHDIGRVGRILR